MTSSKWSATWPTVLCGEDLGVGVGLLDRLGIVGPAGRQRACSRPPRTPSPSGPSCSAAATGRGRTRPACCPVALARSICSRSCSVIGRGRSVSSSGLLAGWSGRPYADRPLAATARAPPSATAARSMKTCAALQVSSSDGARTDRPRAARRGPRLRPRVRPRACRPSPRRADCGSWAASTPGRASVKELAGAWGWSRSAVSHQLRLLRHLGLVVGERHGRQIVYDLYDDHVGELLEQAISHVEHVRLGLAGVAGRPRGPRHARDAARHGLHTATRHGHGHTPRPRRPSRSSARARACAPSRSASPSSAPPRRRRPRSSRCRCVALLADLIHNVGDALTAIPLGIAFLLRSRAGGATRRLRRGGRDPRQRLRGRRGGGRPPHRTRRPSTTSGSLAVAGAVGFLGNEVAARSGSRAGHRLDSPALIADGNHARSDGLVSLGRRRQRGGRRARAARRRPAHRPRRSRS